MNILGKKERIDKVLGLHNYDNFQESGKKLKSIIRKILYLYEENASSEDLKEYLEIIEILLDSETTKSHLKEFELPQDRLNLKELEKEIVIKALNKFKGNKTKTAEYLGLTRSALRSKLF